MTDTERKLVKLAKLERLAAAPSASPGERDNASRMAARLRRELGLDSSAAALRAERGEHPNVVDALGAMLRRSGVKPSKRAEGKLD